MNPISSHKESPDIPYMRRALQQAARALQKQEVPVGAIVVCGKEVIGLGHNRRETRQDPVAHAEIHALQDASAKLKSWRLEDCTLYVTLEPCIMCVGAILQARIARLVFGCLDPKGGAVESLYHLCEDRRLNHQVAVTRGVMEEECARILEEFFANLRKKKLTVTAGEILEGTMGEELKTDR